ncbi:MAG: hypothetical protein FJ137_09155 [Deltaproteobacteria bacterium]|nr:hypothetical protein [Deltaproteobacteria bacterium]
MTPASWVLALALAAHSRSEGAARLVVFGDGRVDLVVTLGTPDMPELCDADLAVVDPARRAAAEQKVTTCVEAGLPRWLRLRVDDEPCTLAAGSWRRVDGRTVELATQARCAPPAGRALAVDWGLFSGSPLEFVAAVVVTLPDGGERRALLSRRHNRVVVAVPAPPWRRALPWAAGAAALAVAVTLVVRGRRRRPAPPAGPSQQAR